MILLVAFTLASAANEQSAQKPRTVAPFESYLRDDDYPQDAIRNEEQGAVDFALHVSATGEITGCSVVKSSGSATLDETTCKLMTDRLRFIPARDRKGRAVAAIYRKQVLWRLPESQPDTPPPSTKLRAVADLWEVTADGRQRSCRRELEFEEGERIIADVCSPLDPEFVASAAAYLSARPEEILTFRLERRWLLDPVAPFEAPPAQRGELLSRGEGSYRLNKDLSVRDCVEGRFSAKFDWKTEPCFQKTFTNDVPPETELLRMEVQWMAIRGRDQDRPAHMPLLVKADGKTFPLNIPRPTAQESDAGPR